MFFSGFPEILRRGPFTGIPTLLRSLNAPSTCCSAQSERLPNDLCGVCVREAHAMKYQECHVFNRLRTSANVRGQSSTATSVDDEQDVKFMNHVPV
ncbi:hypothetical protein JOB18_029815 [Solea senegalensis]|uniref:Secreted protein n=1 Tax=Solea senegalensis TaxID=28829 RepID=A0AAV6PJT0_SOLSE|nr:hypothetical protein JOB18_029815 [Solea senegalensis]